MKGKRLSAVENLGGREERKTSTKYIIYARKKKLQWKTEI